MHYSFRCALATTLVLATLSGCASAPPTKRYAGPDPSQPSAQLTVFPESTRKSKAETERLERQEVQCLAGGKHKSDYSALAAWESWEKEPKPVVVKLPAGRALFWYEKTEGKSTCSLSFSAQLEAGHAYAVKMAENYKGWIKGTDCVLRMVDTTTGQPVKMDTQKTMGDAYYGSICPKPAAP